jgi:hypothetical protein
LRKKGALKALPEAIASVLPIALRSNSSQRDEGGDDVQVAARVLRFLAQLFSAPAATHWTIAHFAAVLMLFAFGGMLPLKSFKGEHPAMTIVDPVPLI